MSGDLARVAAETREAVARVVAGHAAEQAALRREHDAHRAAADRRAAALADAARRGEHGPDAQRLQRRLDAGDTSWADVLSGRDRDPTAERARVRLRATGRAAQGP